MAIQDKFNKPNVIYKITKDIDLNGGTLTIPAGCTLDFQGGSFKNGVINFNNAKLIGSIRFDTSLSFKDTPFNSLIDITWFGAKGDNLTDNASILNHVITNVNSNYMPCTIFIPSGMYKYSDIINIKCDKLTIKGEGAKETYMIYTGSSEIAFSLDAMNIPDNPNQPFLQINLSNLVIIGNNNVTKTIYANGLAYCSWEQVYAVNANPTNGVNFYFDGVQISSFKNCGVLQYVLANTGINWVKSYTGISLEIGHRAGTTLAGCTANNFDRCYFKEQGIGVILREADQNQFICVGVENCTNYGLIIGENAKYNTFIGAGFENYQSSVPAIDIVDQGTFTKYIGCYVSNHIKIQGNGIDVDNLYCTGVQIVNTAQNTTIKNIKTLYFNYGNIKGVQGNGINTFKYFISNYSDKQNPVFDNNIYLPNVVDGKVYRVKSLTDITTQINTLVNTNGFIPYFSNDSVGIGIDRESLSSPSAVGSFRLYSKVDEEQNPKFRKLLGVDTWSPELTIGTHEIPVSRSTTEARPTVHLTEGRIHYDSTLKKCILWNGTAWVNLDGTALA